MPVVPAAENASFRNELLRALPNDELQRLPGRLARWLLMSRDRIDGDDLPMTQEFLSTMLGVRRAGISVVANALQAQGLIRQSRGRITVLDRAGLEGKACTCYRMIEHNRARIMGTARTADAPPGPGFGMRRLP